MVITIFIFSWRNLHFKDKTKAYDFMSDVRMDYCPLSSPPVWFGISYSDTLVAITAEASLRVIITYSCSSVCTNSVVDSILAL